MFSFRFLSASDHVSLGIELRAPQIKRRRPCHLARASARSIGQRDVRSEAEASNGPEFTMARRKCRYKLMSRGSLKAACRCRSLHSGSVGSPEPVVARSLPSPPSFLSSLLVHELFYGYLHTRSPTTPSRALGSFRGRAQAAGRGRSRPLLFISPSLSSCLWRAWRAKKAECGGDDDATPSLFWLT